MSFSNSSTNPADKFNEVSLSSTSSGTESGSGGDVLNLWTLDRVKKMKQSIGGSFTNNSSFKIPAGFVDTLGFDTAFENQENFLGVTARGMPLDVDGTPLSGEVKIEEGGNVVSSKTVSDVFVIASPPPSGISEGGNTESGSYDFVFEPSLSGVSKVDADIPQKYDAGNFQYGSIEGEITNYDGDPVENASLKAPGIIAKTDSKGNYKLVAPGNTTVEVTAVGKTDSYTPTGGSTIVVDFQFSRVKIKVIDPGGNGLNGVPVELSGNVLKTDGEGAATLERAEIKTYEVFIDGSKQDNLNVGTEGSLVSKSYGSGQSGVMVLCKDIETNSPVQSVGVKIEGDSIASETNPNGKGSSVTPSSGEYSIIIAEEDRRFNKKVVEESLTENNVVEIEEELQRRTNTGTM